MPIIPCRGGEHDVRSLGRRGEQRFVEQFVAAAVGALDEAVPHRLAAFGDQPIKLPGDTGPDGEAAAGSTRGRP